MFLPCLQDRRHVLLKEERLEVHGDLAQVRGVGKKCWHASSWRLGAPTCADILAMHRPADDARNVGGITEAFRGSGEFQGEGRWQDLFARLELEVGRADLR